MNTESMPAEVAVISSPLLAWDVELHDMHCICFATTKAKAQWLATKAYWEAYGRGCGNWPRAHAVRAPHYDRCSLKDQQPQRAWTEDHVRNYPSR